MRHFNSLPSDPHAIAYFPISNQRWILLIFSVFCQIDMQTNITHYDLIYITLTAYELEHFLYVYLPYSFLVLWISSLNPTTAWFLKKESVSQNLSTAALFDGAISAVWMKEKQKAAEKVRLYITKLACISWRSPVSFLAYRKSLTDRI